MQKDKPMIESSCVAAGEPSCCRRTRRTNENRGRCPSVRYPVAHCRAPRAELLTAKEFAALVGLPVTLVRELRRTERLAFHKIGRSIYIPASEADRLLGDTYHPMRS